MAASIETTLELWVSSPREVKGRMRPLFTQERVAVSAAHVLDGLLDNEQRKTGRMRVEAVGDPGPWRQRAILGRGRWDADARRDLVRDDVVEPLADDDAVPVIDETGFIEQGKSSCGVSRQYTGSAGQITCRRIGLFADYVSCRDPAFVDPALYLPKSWTGDRDGSTRRMCRRKRGLRSSRRWPGRQLSMFLARRRSPTILAEHNSPAERGSCGAN